MKNNGNIAFLDLVTLHRELEEELVSVIRSALRTAGFIGGPMVEGFENDFARFCGTKHCVGVASGTDALRFALMAAGVKAGDLVITVPNTFIATTEAISQAGALPAFVDIIESTCNMDPEKLREYLQTRCDTGSSGKPVHRETGRPVTAVVPVHLYGRPADMDPIVELAEKHGLIVIEDACQAHGAEYYSERAKCWKKAGSMGAAAAFSFYPGKNLGACGEAGAVTTGDEAMAQKIRMLRDHGQARKYYHDIEGYNGRLDAIQAGILSVKLKFLPDWNKARRELAEHYGEKLANIQGILPPLEDRSVKSVYHLYVIRTERPAQRDSLQARLAEGGVETGLHYPVPLHLQKSYRSMNLGPGSFPVSESVAGRLLSLPMGPTLTQSQIERVTELIAAFMDTPPARARG
ncbi:MAG: DegT/DnrJ/EryC1/StrS family aminotransferase [Syntrophobacteraceae bacterium]|jgi:dTDP-4-amino-4,6-dideoxygalactose transaminase